MTGDAATWAALVGLGAFHGLNPGMGWLFAVALGLQERSRRAVLRALPPIAAGHAVAVVAAISLLQLTRVTLPPQAVAALSAAALIGLGIWHLSRRRHPRWVGMRLRPHELALWSFIMASVHGAGLMLFPVLVAAGDTLPATHPATGLAAAAATGASTVLTAAAIHTTAMLAMMTGTALLVYDHIGVSILRRAWINLDLIWATTLITAGTFAFLL